jgi:hypothetical protein
MDGKKRQPGSRFRTLGIRFSPDFILPAGCTFRQCGPETGLYNRKQNDINALRELDNNLRLMDGNDPVKYDFALFGLGIFEKF